AAVLLDRRELAMAEHRDALPGARRIAVLTAAYRVDLDLHLRGRLRGLLEARHLATRRGRRIADEEDHLLRARAPLHLVHRIVECGIDILGHVTATRGLDARHLGMHRVEMVGE